MLPIDFETHRRRAWLDELHGVPRAYLTTCWVVLLAFIFLGAGQ